jgi:uncharacterized protein (DUF2235 family)
MRVDGAQKKKHREARDINEEFRGIFSVDGKVDIRFLGVWDTIKAFGC